MNKYILYFIYLISVSLCGYLPLKKSNGFDDNVCAYKFSSVSYVRTCKDEGKYCKFIDEKTSICEDIPQPITLKTLGDECKNMYECENGLFCYGGKCSISNSVIGCQTNEEVHRTKYGYECKIKSIEDYCRYKDDTTYTSTIYYSPDYNKVCGEISFKPSSITGNLGTKYNIMTVKSAYIGTVPDGSFVQDSKACKSGYALPFYPDGSLTDPSSDPNNKNKMFLKCVTIKDVNYKGPRDCTFKYDTDIIYHANLLDYDELDPNGLDIFGNFINDNDGNLCYNNLMTKLEMFSKYIGVFNEEKQKNCDKKENYNEPDTCNDNEIRKWLYYYDNPTHYILYYKEKGNDVANFLIQQKYPLYESSKFLSIKFLLSLLLLLLF